MKQFSLSTFCLVPIILSVALAFAPASAQSNSNRIFTRDDVTTLIQKVEEDKNAEVLKMQYFHSRGPKPQLPVSEGLMLLNEALAQEKVGTARWFTLKNVKAWALAQVRESWAAYVKEYDELFSEAETKVVADQDENVVPVIQKAIYDFTLLSVDIGGKVTGRPPRLAGGEPAFSSEGLAFKPFRSKDQANDVKQETPTKPKPFLRESDVALKAFEIYLRLAAQNKKYPLSRPWGFIFSDIGGMERAIEMANAALDSDTPKPLAVYETAVDIFRYRNQSRGIEVLKSAKQVIDIKQKDQVKWLYNFLIVLLQSEERISEAIEQQKEFITLTGEGYSTLAFLYRDAKHFADLQSKKADVEFKNVLDLLTHPDANEADILQLSANLLANYEDEPGKYRADGNRAVALLENYLSNKRKRNVESEIKARLLLAKFYMSNK